MPTPLTKAQLDDLTTHGCPQGCDHGGPGQTLLLNQRCHPAAPKFMERRAGGDVTFRCVLQDCGNKVVVAVQSTAVNLFDASSFKTVRRRSTKSQDTFELLEGKAGSCCDTGAVTASYTHGSGVVNVFCYTCEKRVAEVVLA